MKEKNDFTHVIININSNYRTLKVYPTIIALDYIPYKDILSRRKIIKSITLSKQEIFNLNSDDRIIRQITNEIIINRYIKLNMDEGEE